MKKVIFAVIVLLLTMSVEAKVIKITMACGSTRVFASAQLESITLGNNGTLTVTTYDGHTIDMENASFDVIDIDDDAEIVSINDTVVTLPIGDNPITRQVKKMDFVYPSVDPVGNPVTLSGTVLIPRDIWDGEAKSDGIILVNHFTTMQKNQAPTRGFFGLESLFIASPFKANYICVMSDFFGFGVTERYPQAFVQGTTNGYASIHALLTARKLLDRQGIDYGPLLFNMGYSSGGFDAIATQKVRDNEYRDEIFFDKTFAGGGPYDVNACYDNFLKTDTTSFICGVVMTMVATNELQKLGIPYSDMFCPPFDTKIPAWVLAKEIHQLALKDSISKTAKYISDVIGPKILDTSTPESRKLYNALVTISLTHDWKPDPTQKIYLLHAREDDYVPFASAHPLLDFLKNAGYENNIYGGRTNLQSNFAFKKLGHIASGALFALETLFALTAWPTIYDENHQMKERYADILAQENSSAFTTMALMNEVGIDTGWLRSLFSQIQGTVDKFVQNPDEEKSDNEEEEAAEEESSTLLTLLQTYVDLMPVDETEEAAMNADCGTDVRTYLRRLCNLLILIGVIG